MCRHVRVLGHGAGARPAGWDGRLGGGAARREGRAADLEDVRPQRKCCGGVAPARAYLPDLLPEVLAGTLDPGPIFTDTVALDDIAAGYRAMDERRAIKVMIRP